MIVCSSVRYTNLQFHIQNHQICHIYYLTILLRLETVFGILSPPHIFICPSDSGKFVHLRHFNDLLLPLCSTVLVEVIHRAIRGYVSNKSNPLTYCTQKSTQSKRTSKSGICACVQSGGMQPHHQWDPFPRERRPRASVSVKLSDFRYPSYFAWCMYYIYIYTYYNTRTCILYMYIDSGTKPARNAYKTALILKDNRANNGASSQNDLRRQFLECLNSCIKSFVYT